MPRPPRPKAEHACWVWSLALILPLAFAPRLPAANVITGDVTPALPWGASTLPKIGNTGEGALAVDGGSELMSGPSYLGYNAGSTGTATITGVGSRWFNSSTLVVGYSGSAELHVEAGGQVSGGYAAYLGYNTGSTGTATITGAGSKTSHSTLVLGNYGSGTLRVETGGQVTSSYGNLGENPGAMGMATITGAGSKWTNIFTHYIGNFGSAVFRVEAGGQVTSNYSYLGDNPGAMGMATVTGAGSTWTNDVSLFVGRLGSGTLTVQDGGHVTAGTLFASLGDLHGNGTIETTTGAVLDTDLQFNAAHPSQQVLGFGVGGTLTVTAAGGGLGAGYKGLGSLTMSEGAAISSSGGYLGYNSGSTGTGTITGAGSRWTIGSALYVGNSGSGSLRVAAGGQVSNNSAYLGYNSGSTGTATITGTGATWTNSSRLYVGNSGSGALRVEAGGEVSNSGVGYLGDSTGATGTATITGAGSKWTNSSALYVGRLGSGSLTITTGALVGVGGTLTIDANGGGDSFVNLATGGMLALWGNADDSLAQFLGIVAGTDAILYWNAGLASWTPLTAATLGVDYTLQYLSAGDLTGYTLLTVLAPGPPGDFDGDGRVDGADFLTWQRGDSPLPNSPDDLATWRANLGLGATTPATTAIPEPGTFALFGLAFASLSLACRRAC
jgi:fibronectin-binding autotransporter adhesin